MKAPKNATLLCYVRTRHDAYRHTASGVASATIPQKDALRIARMIEATGSAGEYADRFKMEYGDRLVPGHGVTIVYSSGYRRTLRQGW